MITNRNVRSWLAIPILAIAIPTAAFAEQGDDNPTGVAGAFNGQITTGSSYDPYTGNMQRQIDDIVVPGSIGAYPLKWTRYWNSHTSWTDGDFVGASWRFSYLKWQPNITPDGRVFGDADGVEEWAGGIAPADLASYGIAQYDQYGRTHIGEILHLADGGQVILEGVLYSANNAYYFHPIQIRDPYQTTDPQHTPATTLTWTDISTTVNGATSPRFRLDRITEPGGRYLKVIWDSSNSLITRVEAYDGVNSQPIDWVNYRWRAGVLASEIPQPQNVIDLVTYSDGTSANYTYTPPMASISVLPFAPRHR